MKQLKKLTLILFLGLLIQDVSLAAQNKQDITMNFPEPVLQELIAKSLPLEFKLRSSSLLGSVSIDSIRNLQIQQNKLAGQITLSGHRLNIVTTIADQQLRMKIGSLTMNFQCELTTRLDVKRQILYLRPTITKLQSTDKARTEIASTIALLFNNRELPLQISRLGPMAADTGNKQLNISMKVNDIQLHPDKMQLSISPQIKAVAKKK